MTEVRERLGLALRRAREAVGTSTRRVPKADVADQYFSSGHISLVERGRTMPSPELIETYIGLFGHAAELTALYERAVAESRAEGRRRRQGDWEPVDPIAPQSVDRTTDRMEVQRHYLIESHNAMYTFGPTGAVQEVYCTISLRAKSPEVRFYCAGFSYPTDPREGVLAIEPLAGASLAHLQESDSGALKAYFELDEAMSPGSAKSSVIEFKVRGHSGVRAAPRLRYLAEVGTERVVIGAQFHERALPLRLRRFSVPTAIDAEHDRSGHEFLQQESNFYESIFDHVIPGWCYGFAWSWQRPNAGL